MRERSHLLREYLKFKLKMRRRPFVLRRLTTFFPQESSLNAFWHPRCFSNETFLLKQKRKAKDIERKDAENV